MNINELLEELKRRNISISGRAISEIWGMDETSFSKKKKLGSQIKQKNIMQLEDTLGIKLYKNENYINTLERNYNKNTDLKLEKIGSRIKEIIQKNGLSNSKMADILNTSEDNLINIINGKNDIDIYFLHSLKQNFKVSIDWLLYGE